MLKLVTITVGFLLLGQSAVFSQEDSTRYIFGLPVSEDDTAGQFIDGDLGSKNQIETVNIGKLPLAVRETLDTEEQYQGWRDTLIYFNKNTKLYIVPVRSGESIRIYGINDNGKPVTFSEVTKQR